MQLSYPQNVPVLSFLDQSVTLMAYAEQVSRKLLMQDPETKVFMKLQKT